MFLPVLVNDGVEGETVSPGGGEVSHVHIVVASSLQLAPGSRCQLVLAQLAGSTPNGMIKYRYRTRLSQSCYMWRI